MKIALVDGVEVDDAERPDACGGEVERGRRSEASCAHAQHAPALDPLLTVDADLRQDEVTAVAPNFGVAQFRGTAGRRRRRAGGSPGNRRHDADDIARLELGGISLEIPDVVVVHVDVDEMTQLPVVGVEVPLEIGELRGQRRQHLSDGAAFRVNRFLLTGVRTERRRNQDPVGHINSPSSNPDRSSRRCHAVMSPGVPARTEMMTYVKLGQACSRSYADGRAGSLGCE